MSKLSVYYITTLLAFSLAMLAQPSTRRTTEGAGSVDRPRETPNTAFAVMVGLLLVAVAALRWRVGTDYFTYTDLYRTYTDAAWSSLRPLSEPGIDVLAKAAAWFKDDPASMFALAAVVTVGLSVRTIYKHSRTFALSVTLYILTSSWQGSFNGVRQFLACAILFAGHRYILERKLGRYLLVVGLATSFHVSAMAMVLLYWVPRRRLRPSAVLVLATVAIVAASGFERLGLVFEWFKQEGGSQDDIFASYFYERLNPLRVLAAVAPVLFYVAFTAKSRLEASDFFYVNVLFINAAVLVASINSAYVARFAIYTGIYTALAVPRLFNMRDRKLASVSILLMLALYAVFWHTDTTADSSLTTFRWIFER